MLPKISQITEFTGMQISVSYACFSCAPEKAPEFGAFFTLATVQMLLWHLKMLKLLHLSLERLDDG
jgi:hypothetical protein